jgi:hypothetical protein
VTSTVERVNAVLRELEKKGSRKVRDEMLTRYGITAPKAYGVPVGVIKAMGKKTRHRSRARFGALGQRLV